MHKKILLFASAFVIMSEVSFAQDIKREIDAHAKDPKTKENAAKADVFIHQKHIITDTTTQYKQSVASKKAQANTKKKKAPGKRCSSKTRR